MPSPALTPAGMLALQAASVGNAALARLVAGRARGPLLARTKAEHVEPLRTWRANLQVLEDTVAALVANEQKFNEMYEGYRYVQAEITQIQRHIATAKPLLADVEAENDPDTALKNAISAIGKGGKEKLRLEEVYGTDAVRNARKKLVGERAEREVKEQKANEKAAYEAKSKREAEEKATKEAQAEQQRQTELTTLAITANTTGPAYTRSNNPDERRKLLRYVQLRHPSFSNLSEDEIHQYACFVYHLTLAQIQRVEGFLEGRKVTEWKRQGVPGSRSNTGLHSPIVMPSKVSGLYPEIGAEIFVDWVVHRPRHSSSITRISESFSFTTDEDKFTKSWGTIERRTGNIAYKYTVSEQKLVTNDDRSAIITYFDGHR